MCLSRRLGRRHPQTAAQGVAPGRRSAVLPAWSVVYLVIGLDSDFLF